MKNTLYLTIFLISFLVIGQEKPMQITENKISAETITSFQSYVFDHRFVVPEDMPAGTYRVIISFEIEDKIISNIIIKSDPGYGIKKHLEKIVLSMPQTRPDLIQKLRMQRPRRKDYVSVPLTIVIQK